ncbi:MAG: vanadium-dependent haloperoxidase [Rhizobacter sp.]|nr:vanadium-dependent haloperoxidase [Rhizobacter sp.]
MSTLQRPRATLLGAGIAVWLALQPAGAAAQANPAAPDRATASSRADAYSAGVATEWFALALQLTQQTPGFSPPVAARALAYLGLALYESVVPGMPQHNSLAGQLNELSSLPWAQPDEVLHWPSVSNAALAAMTRMMFGNASAEQKARIDQLERSLPLKYGADFDPTTATREVAIRSENFGKLMAMALMTWARTDGGHEAWGPPRRTRQPYVPPSGPGQWSATPPDFAPALLPWWGENRLFALRRPADCPAPPPPPYSEDGASAFHQEAQEVHRISTQATQEQRQFALYWADDPGKTPTPAGHWAFIATDLLKGRRATLAAAAEAYALLNISMSDAFVVAWHTKYALNLLRPVTYVQRAIDSQWVPTLLNTPPFPEFPSAHSVQSSAAAVVLSRLFGAETAFVDNTHNDRGWGPRSFASFGAAADEAALSRLYAGIHFRTGVVSGKVQGQCVGRAVLALKVRR